MEIDDLIRRLEAATQPDRELDFQISIAVGRSYPHGHYTGSIDAALTLVPERFGMERRSLSAIHEAVFSRGR